MARKPRTEHGSAREKIQEAAIGLFARKGYSRTTTSAIAKAAGVNELTLFRIFGNKKALLHEVYFQMTPVADHVDITGLTDGRDIETDMGIFLRNYLILHIGHMPAYRLSLQLQEEIYDRDLYYASFDNIRGMIAQFIEYLERLGKAGRIVELDYPALAEFMFSLFLIKAIEYTTMAAEPSGYDEKQVDKFVKAHAGDLAKILAP